MHNVQLQERVIDDSLSLLAGSIYLDGVGKAPISMERSSLYPSMVLKRAKNTSSMPDVNSLSPAPLIWWLGGIETWFVDRGERIELWHIWEAVTILEHLELTPLILSVLFFANEYWHGQLIIWLIILAGLLEELGWKFGVVPPFIVASLEWTRSIS